MTYASGRARGTNLKVLFFRIKTLRLDGIMGCHMASRPKHAFHMMLKSSQIHLLYRCLIAYCEAPPPSFLNYTVDCCCLDHCLPDGLPSDCHLTPCLSVSPISPHSVLAPASGSHHSALTFYEINSCRVHSDRSWSSRISMSGLFHLSQWFAKCESHSFYC